VIVKPKKKLGQHFLTDDGIAKSIVDALNGFDYSTIVEIGPGMGVLTKFLTHRNEKLILVEIDVESVEYLQKYANQGVKILQADFLRLDLSNEILDSFAVIGNFPYNISSQILFKVLENKSQIPKLVGMFQKEVAERVCAKPNSKTYGILSVLIQYFYETEYLFTVDENVFHPPPKVKSGVIRLTRKKEINQIDEKLFFQVVKTAFNQRRKKLRNAIKVFGLENIDPRIDALLEKRAEQLGLDDFYYITTKIK
jgi:16S rRNA (adenine1518-N6/adenine1519-N6)-dimethyltransferase